MSIISEKIKNARKGKRRSRSLRFRLTSVMVSFALLIIAVFWTLMTVSLQRYYEMSMVKRSELAVEMLRISYSESKDLDLEEFCEKMTDLSSSSDMYFYVEAEDGSFEISSNTDPIGLRNRGGAELLKNAKAHLKISGVDMYNTRAEMAPGISVLVRATRITSEYRDPILLYSFATLVPLGPAITIIRTMLAYITIVTMFLAILYAAVYSKRMAKPIVEITQKAELLAEGNLDVDFDTTGYAEVEDLGATLTYAADSLEKATNLQKDLVANVSHDLRTPLTMIKSYAELIRDISGDRKEKRDAHLGIIIEETDRLSNLVGDILTLSRLQAKTESLSFSDYDFVKSAEGIFNVYRVLENEGYRLTFDAASNIPIYVHADERRIQQVISNMISNAVRYSTDIKDITLSIKKEGDVVKCTVSDCGIGIAPEDLPTIWNRYQKASKQGTRTKEGTGLGLSIASEILNLHNAEYGVTSKVNVGSKFWFSLKIVDNTEK